MIHLIHRDDWRTYTCDSTSNQMLDTFEKHGCHVISEPKFLQNDFHVNDKDTIIVCISFKTENAYSKIAQLNCKKWLHSIDESKSDGNLFRTQLEMCQKIGTKNIINTYPSEQNIKFLNDHGLTVITLPICGTKRNVNFLEKDIAVLVSGQLSSQDYPVRTRLHHLLSNRRNDIHGPILFLEHAGFYSTNVTHTHYGKQFLSLLDRCWFGITCHAGWRDRMVAKYVEFGFSHVLPIGDVPSYMPNEMKTSMLNIDTTSNDDDIIDSINRLLDQKQTLIDKIEIYSLITQHQFDMNENVTRVISEINND